jgi:hypothetical protein
LEICQQQFQQDFVLQSWWILEYHGMRLKLKHEIQDLKVLGLCISTQNYPRMTVSSAIQQLDSKEIFYLAANKAFADLVLVWQESNSKQRTCAKCGSQLVMLHIINRTETQSQVWELRTVLTLPIM